MADLDLSALIEAVALAAQQASPTVRVVGGTGLALLLGHRVSQDVALFADRNESLQPILDAIADTAADLGATVTSVRTTPRFHRLEVALAGTILRVDIANDASPRLEPLPVKVGSVAVESLRDQRANKLVTVLGRSELRDLVDLYFIERAGWSAIEGLDDAKAKDGGIDPAWLAWAIDQIPLRALPGMIVELDISELSAFRDRLRDQLLDRAGAITP